MTPTPTLSVRADRAAIYYRAARRSRKASTAKQRLAVKLTALSLIYELRRDGKHISRAVERALR